MKWSEVMKEASEFRDAVAEFIKDKPISTQISIYNEIADVIGAKHATILKEDSHEIFVRIGAIAFEAGRIDFKKSSQILETFKKNLT